MKYKKAATLPAKRAIKIPKAGSACVDDIDKKASKQIKNKPGASPSNPSVTLNALANEIITKAAKGINKNPKLVNPIPRIKTKEYPSLKYSTVATINASAICITNLCLSLNPKINVFFPITSFFTSS